MFGWGLRSWDGRGVIGCGVRLEEPNTERSHVSGLIHEYGGRE